MIRFKSFFILVACALGFLTFYQHLRVSANQHFFIRILRADVYILLEPANGKQVST
jgi:hypothetical protein